MHIVQPSLNPNFLGTTLSDSIKTYHYAYNGNSKLSQRDFEHGAHWVPISNSFNCLAGVSIGLNTRNTLKLQYKSLGKPGVSFPRRWQLSLGTQMQPSWQLLAICAHLSAPRTTHRSQLAKLNEEWRSWCYGIKVRASTVIKFSATTLALAYEDSQVVSPTT